MKESPISFDSAENRCHTHFGQNIPGQQEPRVRDGRILTWEGKRPWQTHVYLNVYSNLSKSQKCFPQFYLSNGNIFIPIFQTLV